MYKKTPNLLCGMGTIQLSGTTLAQHVQCLRSNSEGEEERERERGKERDKGEIKTDRERDRDRETKKNAFNVWFKNI